jgi:hypothetical protein
MTGLEAAVKKFVILEQRVCYAFEDIVGISMDAVSPENPDVHPCPNG